MSSLSGRTNNKNIPKFPSDIGTAGQYVKLKTDVNDGFEYVDVVDFSLPIASSNTLGGVKINGNNLTIDSTSGVLSATDTTYSEGDGIDIDGNNVISVDIAQASVIGGVKINGNNLTIDSTSGVLSATNTEYSEGDGVNINNNNVISLDLNNYSQSDRIKLTSTTNDVVFSATDTTKVVKLNIDSDTKLKIANDFNTSSRLQVQYDASEIDYNSDTVNLLVKSVTENTGRDSIISIRGARNGSTTHKVSELRFENNDTQGTVIGVRTLGSICGMVNNSGTNLGDLKFYTFADGETPTETLKLASDGSATFSSTCKATNFKFNDDNGDEQNVRDLYNNALTSIPIASSSVIGGVLISGGNLRINSSTGLLDVLIPTANNNILGGVKIDGNNMEISITGVIGAIVEPIQSLLHVGIFNLQTSENLTSALDTKIRWKPAITNGTSGLLHNATNNIPQGTLFTCNDSDGGVYNLNVQLALTDGTNQGRSFHVIEMRTFTNSANHTGYGTPSRTYFIGSGYARMLTNTNKCIYGGSIQITMQQNDQFEIVSTRKYITNTNALDLNDGVEATRLTIDRVLITNNN